jgi:hypothetical protein
MGLFSWLTANTGRSICYINAEYSTFPVYIHGILPDGTRVRFLEKSYEGSGDFGGKDYFVLLSEMNPVEGKVISDDELHRSRGIRLGHRYKDVQSNGAMGNLKYPQLTESPKAPVMQSFETCCEDCPAQGYFYIPEEYAHWPFFTMLGPRLEDGRHGDHEPMQAICAVCMRNVEM